jgi:hypothetical protein
MTKEMLEWAYKYKSWTKDNWENVIHFHRKYTKT